MRSVNTRPLPSPAVLRLGAAAAALALLPLVLNDPFYLHVLVNALIFLVVLLGLNIVTGLTGQVSLCQAAFYGAGAYTSAILAKEFGAPFWLSLPAGAGAAGLLGLGLSALTVKMRAHYLALATIGFGEILVNVFRGGDRWTGGANGLSSIPPPAAGGWVVSGPFAYYYLTLSAAAVAYSVMLLVTRSQLGNSFSAVRENEVAASSLGMDTVRLKVVAFALGAAYAGAAGALYAHFDGFIGPESFSTGQSILLFSVLVVGGLGRPSGSVIAALLYVLGQEFFRAFAQYQLLLFGATVVVVMIVAPKGVAGLIGTIRRRSSLKAIVAPAGAEEALWELNGANSRGGATIHHLISRRPEEAPGGHAGRDSSSPADEVVIEKVSVRFGGVTALNNVSFDVRSGEILCLIGPNGAGKTSLLNILGGQLKPDTGSVLLRQHAGEGAVPERYVQLVGRGPYEIARLGLSRTFQTSQMFSELSVLENVLAGRYVSPATRPSVLEMLLLPWRSLAKDRIARREAEGNLRFTGLFRHRGAAAQMLPYGLRRVLEVARSMAMSPRVLLLDEPSAGMNQSERRTLARLLQDVRATGVTLLIVAHDIDLVRNLADRVVVLDHGEVIYCGPPDEMRKDERVVRAYLGKRGGVC